MPSSKITAHDLDPNMDLAKESSLQELKELIETSQNTVDKSYICTPSDNILKTVIENESSSYYANMTVIGKAYIIGFNGIIRTKWNITGSGSSSTTMTFYISKSAASSQFNDAILLGSSVLEKTATTYTFEIPVFHGDVLYFYVKCNNSQAITINSITICGDITEGEITPQII